MLVIELGVEGKVIQEIYLLRIVLQFYLSHQRIRIYCRLHLLREVLILVVIHKDTGVFLVLVVQVITGIAQIESKRSFVLQLEERVESSFSRLVVNISVQRHTRNILCRKTDSIPSKR